MACKTNGGASRTTTPRRAGVRFRNVPRHGSDSVGGSMRMGAATPRPVHIEPSLSEIRKRAYFIYLAREGVNGDAAADWTRAERELREEFRAAAQTRRRF